LVDSYPQHVLTTASCFDDDLIHGGVGEVSRCYIYIHTEPHIEYINIYIVYVYTHIPSHITYWSTTYVQCRYT
jgi:hypothetical protein